MKFLEQFRKYKFTDTRIGTDSVYKYSNGNTLPYTGEPFGLNYFCVQSSKKEGSWWFNPNNDNFEGFRLTHQPSPWMGDYSTFTILPVNKKNIFTRKYDTKQSKFLPHFNEILLDNDEVALITASKDSSIIKYGVSNPVFIFEGKNLKLSQNGDLVEGYVNNFSGCEDEDFKMYVVVSSKSKLELELLDSIPEVVNNQETGKYFDRYYIKNYSDELYFSTSFISLSQARYNHSNMTKDFEIMLEETKKKWDFYLDKFEVDNLYDESYYDQFNPYDRLSQEKFFYNCVYRSFLFPMKFYEVDENGQEVHYDTLSKTVKKGKMFTNMGMWDLQKTLFPLFAMVDQNIFEDILEGFINQYRNSGYLPKWLSPDERGLMPGTLVDNVIAEAALKGIGEKYLSELYEALIKGAEVDSKKRNYGRAAVEEYRKYGYVPSDIHEGVNQTLDNCLSDFSISVVASKLGKNEDSQKYLEYSKNYRNIFDKETGFMRAKDRNGKFTEPFDPLNWGSPYTEGSAYQNSYNVYHDVNGLIELFGGKKEFKNKLDELSNSKADFKVGHYGFEIHEMTEFASANFGQIAISNQPSFHIPYLYNFVDEPKNTQLILKELYLNYFRYDFKGYPGDEDNGSMSAWYILSTLGIYPFCPGTNQYELGMPFWNRASVELYNGNKLVVKTNENYHQKKFVNKLLVNGKEYNSTKIDWNTIKNGVELEFTLGLV